MSTPIAKDQRPPRKGPNPAEASFTLFETVLALGILVVMVMQFMSVQGGAVKLSEFDRMATRATWLARAQIAQIEYHWKFRELTDLKLTATETEKEFSSDLCPKDVPGGCPFRYKMSIEEWKLPLLELLTGGAVSADASEEENPMSGLIREKIKENIGDEMLRIAHVEVSWPDGSKRDSVELAYLLTAQQKLDQSIEALDPPEGTGQCKEGQYFSQKANDGKGACKAIPKCPENIRFDEAREVCDCKAPLVHDKKANKCVQGTAAGQGSGL